jgi:hypothetical protein
MTFSRQTKFDAACGAVAFGGLCVVLAGAEAGLPIVAAIGATASAGSGLFSVFRSRPRVVKVTVLDGKMGEKQLGKRGKKFIKASKTSPAKEAHSEYTR